MLEDKEFQKAIDMVVIEGLLIQIKEIKERLDRIDQKLNTLANKSYTTEEINNMLGMRC